MKPNKTTATNGSDGIIEPLAVRAGEACRIMGMSRRKLWELTNRNLIPHVRCGRAILYPVHLLREWLTEQAQKGRTG